MPDQLFWEDRYANNQTGWDTGTVSTPLKEYFDTLDDKDMKILIPGAGNAHEAEYLHKKGFSNVYVLDIAESPLRNLKKRLPDFPEEHMLQADFFAFEGCFDLIIEQTFFCAINPKLRPVYAEKMYSLLKTNGKLVGLLFDIELNKDEPPFGGNKEEYIAYFCPYFTLNKFEKSYNSIPPRAGNELFINLGKRSTDS
jgi:hypothetical protein